MIGDLKVPRDSLMKLFFVILKRILLAVNFQVIFLVEIIIDVFANFQLTYRMHSVTIPCARPMKNVRFVVKMTAIIILVPHQNQHVLLNAKNQISNVFASLASVEEHPLNRV